MCDERCRVYVRSMCEDRFGSMCEERRRACVRRGVGHVRGEV